MSRDRKNGAGLREVVSPRKTSAHCGGAKSELSWYSTFAKIHLAVWQRLNEALAAGQVGVACVTVSPCSCVYSRGCQSSVSGVFLRRITRSQRFIALHHIAEDKTSPHFTCEPQSHRSSFKNLPWHGSISFRPALPPAPCRTSPTADNRTASSGSGIIDCQPVRAGRCSVVAVGQPSRRSGNSEPGSAPPPSVPA